LRRAEHSRRQSSGQAERAHRRSSGRVRLSAELGARPRWPDSPAATSPSSSSHMRHWQKQPAVVDRAALLRFGWCREESGGTREESVVTNQFGRRLVDLVKSAPNRMGLADLGGSRSIWLADLGGRACSRSIWLAVVQFGLEWPARKQPLLRGEALTEHAAIAAGSCSQEGNRRGGEGKKGGVHDRWVP